VLNLARLARNYESSARTFSELVPWMSLVRPDTVLGKDGSLLACYRYDGVDQEGLERSDVDRYAQLVEHGLRNFDERVTVWWTVDRRRTTEYPEAQFSDPISRLVDQEWRAGFSNGHQYVNRYHLAFLYTPAGGAEGLMDKFNYFSRDAGLPTANAFLEAAKAQFSRRSAFAFSAAQIEQSVRVFLDQMGAFEDMVAEIRLARLGGEELLAFLHDRCSPASYGQPVKNPDMPLYLDAYLPDNTLTVGWDHLRFDGTSYAAAVSVKDWPDASEPGLFDALLAVPGELTVSQCFRFVERGAAKDYIAAVERHNRTLTKNALGYVMEAFGQESRNIDYGRMALAEEASEALTGLTTLNRVYGYYNLTVVAHGQSRNECEDTLKAATKVLRRAGFISVRETLHALSAWAGTMPGQWAELVRWFFVNTANLADLSPVRTLMAGENRNRHLSEQAGRPMPALTVFATEYATPFYFNFHMTDLAHTIVVGPSGMGKSTINNFLISQFRKYAPSAVVIFDKDYSCRIPTLLQGGAHVDLAGERGAKVSLNPVLALAERDDWSWLAKWLEIPLTSRGYSMTADDDRILWQAIESVAAQPRANWKLQSFYPFLSKTLGEQLMAWIGDGQLARYFDNREDSFDLAEFTCIEMGGLFQNPRVATGFLEYAFHRIGKRLDGRPTLIYIEEAWFMLEDERFAARVNDWLRTLRKKNALVLLATQSLDEIARSSIFATMVDNIPNRIFLANPNALAHKELYTRKFGLNEAQVNRIRGAIPKLHYYITTPVLSRLVEARFSRKILAVLRSDPRAQQAFDRALGRGGDWKSTYLEEMSNA